MEKAEDKAAMPRGKRPDHASQLSFEDWFEIPQAPEPLAGSLDYSAELCALISDILKNCPKKRLQIAIEMAELLNSTITPSMLNAWTAESKDGHRFPFEYAAALEEVCSTHRLTELLAQKRGCKILIGKEALNAQLGQVRLQMDELKKREKTLRKIMGGGK